MTKSYYLGLADSATNNIFNGTVLPDDYFTYYFDVASGDTLYTQFDLYGFDDDLDLELYKKDASSGNWNVIKISDSIGSDNEFIFKVLGSGEYAIDVVSYSDLDNSGTASDYTLQIDAETWLSTVSLPNDPLFAKQWHLFNAGQGTGIDNKDILAPEAWAIRNSSPNTIVAVIDGGVDLAHEDLKNNLWINPGEIPNNQNDDDGNGKDDDYYGWDFANNAPLSIGHNHGTHVAGTIGAEGNNAIGVTGVTWDVNLMSLDVFGLSKGASSSDIWDAIRYAADHGAHVINMSLGSTFQGTVNEFTSVNADIHQGYLDALNYAVNKGATVVIAAGNHQLSVNNGWVASPAYLSEYMPGVISVGAVANNGQKAGYSNYGSKITIGAPGGDFVSAGSFNEEDALYSTSPISPQLTSSNYQIDPMYGYMNGTSMAAPVVSGAIALMHAQNPSLTPADIEDILLKSAQEFRELKNYVRDGAFLDVENALLMASTATPSTGENVYRLYNTAKDVHLYTNSYLERNVLSASSDSGYRYEGIAYVAPKSGGIPLHRFHNSEKGYHLLTSSDAEADSIIGNPGWGFSYEGRTYGVGTSKTANTPQEVYRFYNRNKGTHFYSSSVAESNSLIANSLGSGFDLSNSLGNDNLLSNGWGYIYEGVAWYVTDS